MILSLLKTTHVALLTFPLADVKYHLVENVYPIENSQISTFPQSGLMLLEITWLVP